jgi:uncharacterized BrkB/YihY/UPF0761 family membrane protein
MLIQSCSQPGKMELDLELQMKKKMMFLFFVTILIVTFAVSISSAVSAQTSNLTSIQQAITPTPAGEISVPGFTIQIIAPGANPLINKPDTSNRVAGVLLGLWHGIIAPITLIVSFVNPSVQMYEVHNDGSPYSLGFLVGVAIVFILLGVAGVSRRRRK